MWNTHSLVTAQAKDSKPRLDCEHRYCYCFQTKKGKSYLALRDLCVVLLNGRCLEVKCDMESTAGAVFNAVMSFANLEETTYFGLAYVEGRWFLVTLVT